MLQRSKRECILRYEFGRVSVLVVVVAWKANLKDTFGILQVLSFEEYLFYLDNRLVQSLHDNVNHYINR